MMSRFGCIFDKRALFSKTQISKLMTQQPAVLQVCCCCCFKASALLHTVKSSPLSLGHHSSKDSFAASTVFQPHALDQHTQPQHSSRESRREEGSSFVAPSTSTLRQQKKKPAVCPHRICDTRAPPPIIIAS